MIKSFIGLLLFLVYLSVGAATNPWYEKSESTQISVNAFAFLSSTCSYCHEMEAFLTRFSQTHPWLKVKKYYINQDHHALSVFHKFLSKDNSYDYYVPSLYFCGSRWVGYIPEQEKSLEQGLLYCAKQLNRDQQLTPTSLSTVKQMASAYLEQFTLVKQEGNLFSPVLNLFKEVSLNLMMIACLLAFLLLIRKTSSRIIMTAGFLLATTLTHYWHQTSLADFSQYLSDVRILSICLGLILIGSLWFKRDIALVIVAILVAFLLQAYTQTAIPNPAFVFQRWLTEQSSHPFLYNLLYHVLYCVFIGTNAWLAYYLMIKRKMHYGEIFAYCCLSYMGVVLIVYPWFFAKTQYMTFILLGLVLISRLYQFIRNRYGKQKKTGY